MLWCTPSHLIEIFIWGMGAGLILVLILIYYIYRHIKKDMT